jgi:hypothetical protein
MGIFFFIFDHEKWEDLYPKNCSLKTTAEWYKVSTPDIPLGLLYSTLRIIFEVSIKSLDHLFWRCDG